jgi:hypothetical protein
MSVIADIGSVASASDRYWHWLRRQVAVVEEDLEHQHELMSEGVFAFFRGAYWKRHGLTWVAQSEQRPRSRPTRKTRREQKVDELTTRCSRILDEQPRIGPNGAEALCGELLALQAVLANASRQSATEVEVQCQDLLAQLRPDAGDARRTATDSSANASPRAGRPRHGASLWRAGAADRVEPGLRTGRVRMADRRDQQQSSSPRAFGRVARAATTACSRTRPVETRLQPRSTRPQLSGHSEVLHRFGRDSAAEYDAPLQARGGQAMFCPRGTSGFRPGGRHAGVLTGPSSLSPAPDAGGSGRIHADPGQVQRACSRS